MDIILQTNTDNPFMKFGEVERFHDGSGYSTNLLIRSDWLTAEYHFIFESHPLIVFLNDLENIDQTLVGVARLKPSYEPQFIEIEGTSGGHVRVRGELIEHSHLCQRIIFEFETDQTCLRPLINSFKAAQTL